jgi:hypothetical protein
MNTNAPGVQWSPAAAALPDGHTLVVWEDCSQTEPADMDRCAIRGRALLPNAMPLGPDFAVNTKSAGTQTLPSVTAVGSSAFFVIWTDGEGSDARAPGAIRGRFIYPDFNRSDGNYGARCDDSHPCIGSLRCAEATQGELRCHQTCGGPGPGSCSFGGLCTATPQGMVCRF